MTPQEILDAIAASAELQAMQAAGNHAGIAAALSVGRTRLVPTEAGVGLVLETLGFGFGNALLDLLTTQPAYRHVRPLLEQGRMRLDSPVVLGALQSLVGQTIAEGVTFTQSHADALRARASVPDPIQHQAVTAAIRGAE